MDSKLFGITNTILFIDPNVDNYYSLVNGANPNIKIVILDTYRDGIQQITETLIRNHRVKAIHIVSHGTSGCLYLGNSELNLETIENYTKQLQQWGEILEHNADILIYGCNVAADLVFVQKLRELTGANIAASATPTGNAKLGGDWNLEVSFGKVSTPIAFTAEVRQAYSGILAQINVSITDDTVDGDTSSIGALLSNPGTDGEISLREAIVAANNTAGDDTINLIGGETYTLTIAGSEEDDSETGDLDIKDNGKVVVQTLGNVTATIDAGGENGLGDRVFDVREDASLKLDNMVVTGGVVLPSYPYYDDNGGGIQVNAAGILELTNSTVSGNSASNSGGGIWNYMSTSIITNSNITGNLAANPGGGIANMEGTVNITNSNIRDNSAATGGGILNFGAERDYGEVNLSNSIISGNSAANGGGIASGGGRLNISHTTFSDNIATNAGGGINASSSTNIKNSTFKGNSAEKGGGISVRWSATISNSTISGNSATDGGGISNSRGTVEVSSSTISENTATSKGSGLYNYSYYDPIEGRTDTGIAEIGNSIIAGNHNDKDIEGDGIFTSNGYNLIGNDTTAEFNQIGDQTGDSSNPLDPKLGPLQKNGGLTETHALLADSPAIDAGNTDENYDQRGAARDSNPDIGAFEFGGIPIMIQEPNDTLLRATYTGLTIRNYGTFSHSGEVGDNPNLAPEADVDFFKFDLGWGDQIRLPEIIELVDENGNYIADSEVRVFDPTGAEIFPDFSDPFDPNYRIYNVQEPGTFYVGISGDGNTFYNPDQADTGSGTPGKYDLTIETIGREMGGSQTGKLYFSADYTNEGLYTLNTTTGNASTVVNGVGTPALAPSDSSSFLYGSDYNGLLKINADGSYGDSIGNESIYSQGLAYDPANNILYGIEGGQFYTISPNTGHSMSLLASPFITLEGLAFGNGGVYGLGSNSQDLMFYDPNTDNWSVIGETGISSWQDAGLAFDAEKNVLYAKRDGDTSLYEINVSTAQTTEIGDTGIMGGGGLAFITDNVYEESNDTIARATHTGLTHKNHGIFSYFGEIGDNTNLRPQDDVDLFKFHLDLGETVRLPKNIKLLDENGFSIADAEVQLFDAQGIPLTLFSDSNYFVYDVYEPEKVGTFYVGISSDGNTNYNLNTEGSGTGSLAGNYGLTIETIGREIGQSQSDRLFAVKNDDFNQIVELNPLTGEEINSFSVPEPFSPGPQGLAFNGDSLFFVSDSGSGTKLWELDPDTGYVRDSDQISVSGGFDGLAALDGKLYILDITNSDIVEFDPVSDTVTNILDIDGTNNGVLLVGGLAAITGPNALLATDNSSSELVEINPTTGEITNSFPIPNGSHGVAVIDGEIYVGHGDFTSAIEVFDRSGSPQRTIDLNYPVWALGGDDSGSIKFAEPNDTLVRATHTGLTLVNPGTFTYSGEIGDNTNILPKADVDLFKFDLDAGETVSLPGSIEIRDDESGDIANAELRLFDATGNPLSFDSQNPESKIYQATATGTFYVGVSGNGNSSYNPNQEGSGSVSWVRGNYDLTIETTGSRTGDESNDIRVEAVDTGLHLTNAGVFNYAGEIGDNVNVLPENDVDLFKFELDIGEQVKFSEEIQLLDENGNPIAPGRVQLFDANGMPLFGKQDPDGETFADRIYRAEFEPETLYIGVSGDMTTYDPSTNSVGDGGMPNEVGSYDLTIETVGREMGDDETNDILTEAVDTGLNLTNAGVFNYAGEIGDNVNLLPENDVDLFKFELDIGEQVKFSQEIQLLDENGNPIAPGRVKLFDANGMELFAPEDPDGETFSDRIYRAEFEPETLYIGVSGMGTFYDPSTNSVGNGGMPNEVGSYDLTIETVGRTMGDDETNDILTEAVDTGLNLTNAGVFNYAGEIGDNVNVLPETDVDLFKLELDIGEQVKYSEEIQLLDENGNPIAPGRVKLFDADGMQLFGEQDPDGETFSDRIYRAEFEPETLYIGVSGIGTFYDPSTNSVGNGGMSNEVGSYDLTIETVGREIGDDETNDILTEAVDTGLTLTNAGVFNYAGEIGDNVNLLPENDVDLFKFELDIGEQVKFSQEIQLLDENGNPIAPGRVKLFDANGMELFAPEDPDGETFADRIYRAEFEPETLYIGVSGIGTFYDPSTNSVGNGGMSNEVGSYDLTIETTATEENMTNIFINELHYDNDGTDSNEFIEILGPAGTDLTGWSIVLYNGNGGAPYDTQALSGTITDQSNGFGTVAIDINGIQNGPDAIALVDNSNTVVQFLSYEGSFTATDGSASGMTSTDIGVSQTNSTPVNSSLQLQGTGTEYADFTWVAVDGSNTKECGLNNLQF